MSKITSSTNVRRFALAVSILNRQGKFKRVSKDFLDRIEAKVRNLIVSEINQHPSVGQTLK